MFCESDTERLLRQELLRYGLSKADIFPIREKEGIAVARIRDGGKTYVLKCFRNEADRRETENYRILQSCGVPTLHVYGCTEASLLLEDLEGDSTFRLGSEADLRDPAVIRLLAKWYRRLHQCGETYVRRCGAGMYDETDCYTLETLDALKTAHPCAADAIEKLERSFFPIRHALDALSRTLTYNDFYWTNLAVARDKSAALMFDYNLLGKGYRYADTENVTYWFDEECKRAFFDAYGAIERDAETLHRIVSPIVSLHSAYCRGIFPDWADDELRRLIDEVPDRVDLFLNRRFASIDETDKEENRC